MRSQDYNTVQFLFPVGKSTMKIGHRAKYVFGCGQQILKYAECEKTARTINQLYFKRSRATYLKKHLYESLVLSSQPQSGFCLSSV